MRKSLFAASVVMVLLVMTGCRHRKAVVLVPPPPPTTVKQHVSIPPATLSDMPRIPAPVPPDIVLGGALAPAPPKHDSRRSWDSPSAENTRSGKPGVRPSAAVGEEPLSGTPIGKISAAPNTQGLPSGANIAREIQWIQTQLSAIHRVLNAKELDTVSQIRTFLSKAKNALQAGDLDGANTLTVKARVLLREIQ